MRRSIAVLALALAVSAGLVTGCGAGEPESEPRAAAAQAVPPQPEELLASALDALEDVRSGHYALDVTVSFAGGEVGGAPESVAVRIEGDASENAATAAVTVEAGGQRLSGDLRFRQNELFVRVFGTWYGGAVPLVAADDGRRELATPGHLRRHFEDVLTGRVEEGPLVDGVATWSYAGSLNVAGLRALVEEYGHELGPEEREQLGELARTAALRLLVSKDDHLPRKIELDLRIGRDALAREDVPFEALEAAAALRLSDFGKPVLVDVPERYRPLEELVGSLLAARS